MGTALRRRRVAACAAAAVSALALSACLPGGGGGDGESSRDASPGDSAEADPSGESGEGGGGDPTPPEAEEFTEPQQRELTSEEAKAALPTVEDMPDEHYVEDISVQGIQYSHEPKECAAIEFASDGARAFSDEHRTTRENARFGQSMRDGNGFLGVWIDSYDEPYPLAYFDQAGAAISECTEFDLKSSVHTTTRKTKAISAPAIRGAERVFAVRILSSFGNIDRLYVRSGHNRILVMQRRPRDEPFDERLLTKHAEAVLDHLKKDS